MNISILTVFPDLYTPFISTSLIARAREKGLFSLNLYSYFSYVAPKERIDAPSYGPGAGMLIRPDVVQAAVEDIDHKHGASYKIFFSPQGEKLTHQLLTQIYQETEGKHLALLPARYEGMDARVEELYADRIISVGDFVLMGGDIPAMMFLEAYSRLIPGVVGKASSVEHDSFTGPFVDYPEYTEPLVWHDKSVPDIVRSGNHKEIEKWRTAQAAEKTVKHHFQWVRSYPLQPDERAQAQSYIPPHYVALMHTDVLVGKERQEGTTSVTSIDMHDIARSSRTYGISTFFIVTPLEDQQTIVKTLLSFWQEGHGIAYNPSRHEAVKQVELVSQLDDAIATITKIHGVAPLLVATSAQSGPADKTITYNDQELVWKHNRPVLFLFGTGQGLSPALLERVDYLLVPIEGFGTFNHLSVRSAVAVILDRWLGLQPRKI